MASINRLLYMQTSFEIVVPEWSSFRAKIDAATANRKVALPSTTAQFLAAPAYTAHTSSRGASREPITTALVNTMTSSLLLTEKPRKRGFRGRALLGDNCWDGFRIIGGTTVN
jgi:hypothetical protein